MEPVVNGIESNGDVESDEVIKKQEHTWIDNNKSHSNLIFDSHIELKATSKFDHLKETFLDWSLNADINGYKKIFQYEHFSARFLFAIILVVSSVLTIWLILECIWTNMSFDVITKIEFVHERPSEFPSITFCDLNFFATPQARLLLDQIARDYDLNPQNDSFMITTLAKMYAASPNLDERQKRNLNFDFKQNLQECSFSKNDCIQKLTWLYSYDFGNCFQFNVNDSIHQSATISGTEYGFIILKNSFYTFNPNYSISNDQDGMIVFVHNRSLIAPTLSNGVYIKSGEMTYINVKRKHNSKSPSPYSQCSNPKTFSSYLYDFIVASGSMYRQEDCINLCIQEQIVRACECFFLKYKNPFNESIQPCLNLSQAECILEQFNSLNIDECHFKFCPLECNTYSFELSLSSSTMPTLNNFLNLPKVFKEDFLGPVFNLNNRSLTYDVYRSAYVSMNVYYSSLDVEIISETPKVMLSDLFVQIGSSLGIFISFSVFTFVEFAEIFFRIVYLLVRDIRRKESNSKQVMKNQVENDDADSTATSV